MSTLDFAAITYPINFGCRFGPWVIKPTPTGPYVMYWSGNFLVKDGKPTDGPGPYDPNTWNAGCNTFYGDRIWMSVHHGDGIDPAGWESDGVSPTLIHAAGGVKEQSLVGDPTVVYWNNKWHMYYEGTDYCDGTNGLLFHSTADSWAGPWTKQGRIWGPLGHIVTCGFNWAGAFVENGELYLYYNNAHQRTTCAKANEPTGTYFDMMNQGMPVYDFACAEGQVLADGNGGYILVVDGAGQQSGTEGKGIYISFSQDKFNFPLGELIIPKGATGASSANSLGLPCALLDNGKLRVYYTARPEGTTVSSIGVGLITL